MKTAAKPLTAALALLALAACGDDAATRADADAPGDSTVETARAVNPEPSSEATAETAQKAPAVETEQAEAAPEPAAPEPEPVKPIVAFKGQDGELSLAREALTMISPVHDADTDAWSVFVQLDETAAEDFYTLTAKTAGEALSVVVDGMTVSAPTLETAVYGGGFVFPVDDGAAANRVVAALKGEQAPPAIIEVDAGDALPDGEPPAQDTAATGTPEDEDG